MLPFTAGDLVRVMRAAHDWEGSDRERGRAKASGNIPGHRATRDVGSSLRRHVGVALLRAGQRLTEGTIAAAPVVGDGVTHR